MKKDIEWLKKEIATEMIELEPNRKERWSDVRYQTLRNVAQKIDQLDELKVLSQEWIDNNVVHIRGLGDIFEAENVENLLVPKQELPVIPQFVADWIEHCKENNLDLYEAFGHSDMSVEVSDFIGDMDADEFARAWLDYPNIEVEKERLYKVELPTETLYHILIMRGDREGYLFGKNHINNYWYRTHLTEKEIKGYDPRFWPFAEEVSE